MAAITTINSLKQRALSLLGDCEYNEDGQDVASQQVDLWHDAALREFLAAHPWTWAAVKVTVAPDDILVLHWHRGEQWLYTPTSVVCVPDEQPLRDGILPSLSGSHHKPFRYGHRYGSAVYALSG